MRAGPNSSLVKVHQLQQGHAQDALHLGCPLLAHVCLQVRQIRLDSFCGSRLLAKLSVMSYFHKADDDGVSCMAQQLPTLTANSARPDDMQSCELLTRLIPPIQRSRDNLCIPPGTFTETTTRLFCLQLLYSTAVNFISPNFKS